VLRADGTPIPGLYAAGNTSALFLDRHLHRDRDPTAQWPDFPPKTIERLAALPAPPGPVVTWPG
jgi:hypothetical protein